MGRFLEFLDVALISAAVAVPAAVVTLVALARRRIRHGVPPAHAWTRSTAEVGMAAGTVPWLVMALWPIELPPDAVRWYLLPLVDITRQLSALSPLDSATQIGGNLVMLLPLGMGAPVRWPAFTGVRPLRALGVGASLAIEAGQQVFGTGRVFSVDDVLLNAAGCLLGGLATRRWWYVAPARGTRPRAGSPGLG